MSRLPASEGPAPTGSGARRGGSTRPGGAWRTPRRGGSSGALNKRSPQQASVRYLLMSPTLPGFFDLSYPKDAWAAFLLQQALGLGGSIVVFFRVAGGRGHIMSPAQVMPHTRQSRT